MKALLYLVCYLSLAALTITFDAKATPISGQGEQYRIGVIVPLSGPAADYGRSMQNSLAMAAEDYPALYHKMKFIYEDSEHRVPKAVSAFHKLRTLDQVDMIYTFGVSFCKALAPLADQYSIPVIGQCIDATSSKGKEYFLRFMNNTDEYLRAQTRYLAEQGIQKIGVVLTEHPYLEEMYAALERSLQPQQTLEIVDRYDLAAMDFRATLARIRRSDFDAIGVFVYPGQISSFYRQARNQQITLPTFGTNFFESLSTITDANGAMNGAVFVANAAHEEFTERYRSRYHQATQIGFGALAYEFGNLLGSLLQRTAMIPDGEGMLTLLRAAPERPGTVTGPYHYEYGDEFGSQFTFPLTVKRIEGGQIVALKEQGE